MKNRTCETDNRIAAAARKQVCVILESKRCKESVKGKTKLTINAQQHALKVLRVALGRVIGLPFVGEVVEDLLCDALP